MKKIVSLILVIALLITTLFILAGCGKASVVGTWSGKNNDDVETEWEFKKDGRCIMKNAYGYEGEGTDSIEDTKLKIKLNLIIGFLKDINFMQLIKGIIQY